MPMAKNMKMLMAFYFILLYFLDPARGISRSGDDTDQQENQCPLGCYCVGDSVTCPNWLPPEVPLPLPRHTTVLSLPNFGAHFINRTYFLKTPNLQWLQISGSLKSFPELPYLPNLSYLDLSNSHMASLPPNALKFAPHLTHLNISNNNLTSIHSKFLAGLSNLRVLDISDNPFLPQIPIDFFSYAHALNHLDLSSCNIRSGLGWLRNLQYLYSLNISYNKITSLDSLSSPVLGVLDVSYNPVTSLCINNLPNLNELFASHTSVSHLDSHCVSVCHLKLLDLAYTKIEGIKSGTFKRCANLKILNLSYIPHFKIIEHRGLEGLRSLQHLDLSYTPSLKEIDNSSFIHTPHLEELILESSNLKVLPSSISSLKNLTLLNIESTYLICSCYSHWISTWISLGAWPVIKNSRIYCTDRTRTVTEFVSYIDNLDCRKTKISPPKNQWVLAPWEQSATLDCNVTGTPTPTIIWQTANHHYIMFNKSDADLWVNSKISRALDISVDDMGGKYQVLPTGQIIIRNVSRSDIGRYKCFAYNSVSNASITMFLGIQDTAFRAFVMESQSFGLACAALFLFLTLLVQLIRGIMYRFGLECCCYENRLRSRAQHLKQLLESVEFYKSAQLEKLRENYNYQVASIKEGCYQQMERLRESYAHQSKNLRDLREYSTQQFTGARDQYVDQVNRVRDYSLSQMNRVRENYVYQRQRIRKFSAHQLIRLRETYKYQQKTVNKLIENLPDLSDLYIQNCRTGSCQRTESVLFDEIDGLDVYYKVDFLDTQSQTSDYFTPTGTLQRQKIKYKVEVEPEHKKHHRSFSLVNTSSRVSELIKGHKRSSSVTQAVDSMAASSTAPTTEKPKTECNTPLYTPMTSPRCATPEKSFSDAKSSDIEDPIEVIISSTPLPKYETSL